MDKLTIKCYALLQHYLTVQEYMCFPPGHIDCLVSCSDSVVPVSHSAEMKANLCYIMSLLRL